MKKKLFRSLSILLTFTLLLCFSTTPLHSFAYSKDSEQRLPHTGATWKSWAQGGGDWGLETIAPGKPMANKGCVVTSVAMAAKSYRALLQGTTVDTVTPLTFLQKCKSVGALNSSGDYVWGNTSLVLPQLVYRGSKNGLNTIDKMTNEVESYLNRTDAHYVVLVCFGGNHYVVADYISSGVLYVYDPAEGDVTTLQTALNRKSYYSLSGIFYFAYNGALRGDVDGNGIVDSTDARLVLQLSVGSIAITSLANPEAADFNGDGSKNSTDASLILQNTTHK
ncbi:MAG: hypothetical protein E7549_06460 [Ruminococcaceae bacterium]|nr:hypothetical protein [Oscillospiraceae bacterium]